MQAGSQTTNKGFSFNMCELKLVRSLLILALFNTLLLLHIKGVRTHSEEEDAPDTRRLIDQRQNGKYNIHIVIKNVAIIEMERNEIDEPNYSDDDYYYNEDDLTVKPHHTRPTKNSANSSNYKTTLPMQTTISPTESYTEQTTSKDFQAPQTTNIPETNHRPAFDNKSYSKVKPIRGFDEQAFQRRNNVKNAKHDTPYHGETGSSLQKEDLNNFSNSRVQKLKVVRSIRVPQNIPSQRERCRPYQYRDNRGNCRAKKSSSSSSASILKRLFRMLLELPFKHDE